MPFMVSTKLVSSIGTRHAPIEMEQRTTTSGSFGGLTVLKSTGFSVSRSGEASHGATRQVSSSDHSKSLGLRTMKKWAKCRIAFIW